jgi:hypothetical protein
MRYTTAWSNVLSQNVTLRFAVLILGVTTTALAYSAARMSFRPPLIIERGCFSKGTTSGSTEVTPDEMESFVREALKQRFDSQAKIFGDFLSNEEMAFRTQEQKELTTRSISQKVLVNSLRVEGNKVFIESDRLISVGTIRSAFPFNLQMTLSSQSRTYDNPYGLTALKITEQKSEGTK